jgi:cytochrome b
MVETQSGGTAGAGAERVRVWDLPTRLFHWALVVLVATSYLTAEVWRGVDMQWHKLSGYAILALVLFRVAWGFVGTRHARFAGSVRSPARTLGYLRDLIGGRNSRQAGHNPLGALSVMAFLAVLLVQAGSGLFASDDIFIEGPLAELVSGATVDALTAVHHFTFNLLLALVGLHLVAIAVYEGAAGQRLVRAMLSGYKPKAPDARESVPLAWARGLLLLIACAGLVVALVWGLPRLLG